MSLIPPNSNPIVVTPPPLGDKTFEPITIDELKYQVTYDNSPKIAFVVIKKVNLQVTLWSGADYDAAGQFTDADVAARLTVLLGSTPEEISASLLKLYKRPPVVKHVPATPAPAPDPATHTTAPVSTTDTAPVDSPITTPAPVSTTDTAPVEPPITTPETSTEIPVEPPAPDTTAPST